ncbi:DUF4845 domain-containing protein [Diaphorobacter sp. HDW4A]|uniref:DUF4845 domain-containing protein n=1 Tax=Diaphorobacter sp. HDW4A TaxID=2714924 RepID=UPI00140C0A5F|nr:DUF4845 domain-containing protein [Diaphorobacter sp. HDW4A]QIL78692.1 DUF4845 domain-containing protein [Diaphorobacter sp. HDW4A]
MAMHRISAPRSRQRGLSFVSLVFLLVVFVSIGYVVTKSLPVFLEWQSINKAVKKAAAAGTTVADVRSAYQRSADIDNITSVSSSDLEITKENEKVVVSYDYSREVPLYGPAYLLYKFQGSSNK